MTQMSRHTLMLVAFFTEEVNPRLAKRPLKTNERIANLELTSLVKEATVRFVFLETPPPCRDFGYSIILKITALSTKIVSFYFVKSASNLTEYMYDQNLIGSESGQDMLCQIWGHSLN